MDTSLSPAIEFDATAAAVRFEGGMMRVELADAREIAVPLEYSRGFAMHRLTSWPLMNSSAGGTA